MQVETCAITNFLMKTSPIGVLLMASLHYRATHFALNFFPFFFHRRAASLDKIDIQFLPIRSEEHTSELQSRQYLVCRLLLEKKKQSTNNATILTKIATKITVIIIKRN